VLDIRTLTIETPRQIVARIKKVIAAVSPERVTLSTDCGMKPPAGMVAKTKLKALVAAARTVRGELLGVS
jgi:5-methyltetrahydropteroyltriglutamate--homocysteine methyltransferase